MKFGIVQGRLTQSKELQSFPKDWQREFYIAEAIGLDYIELVSERTHNTENPIWSTNIVVLDKIMNTPVVCNDYMISHSLKEDAGCRLWTNRLIEQANLINCRLVVLPIMEESEYLGGILSVIRQIESYAAKNNTAIGLETTENDHPFNIVYDTGNRVAEGLNLALDIKMLGKRIVHVHIKDKDWKGDNVLLGTGMVDFKEVCKALKDIGYDGTMTFETVRGKDPIRTAKYNLDFIKFFMAEAA